MTTATATGLTREQLKAFRNADSVVFRWEKTDQFKCTGEIDLQKETQRTDGFGEDTLHVKVPADAIVSNYGHHDDPEARGTVLDPAISGTWVMLYIQQHLEWVTFANFLKPGDEVVQEWVVDNRNLLLRKANLTHHELKVRVRRPGRDGRIKQFSFLLDAGTHNPYGLADNVKRARS